MCSPLLSRPPRQTRGHEIAALQPFSISRAGRKTTPSESIGSDFCIKSRPMCSGKLCHRFVIRADRITLTRDPPIRIDEKACDRRSTAQRPVDFHFGAIPSRAAVMRREADGTDLAYKLHSVKLYDCVSSLSHVGNADWTPAGVTRENWSTVSSTWRQDRTA